MNNAIKVIQHAGARRRRLRRCRRSRWRRPGDAPPMPARDLYNNGPAATMPAANSISRCRSFNDYLKCYGNTELAPNAQFYIAMIHFAQGNYENAVKEFDMVLEKYPDNNKTADALLYKGRALVKMRATRPKAPTSSWKLIKRFPKSDQAVQACTERKLSA